MQNTMKMGWGAALVGIATLVAGFLIGPPANEAKANGRATPAANAHPGVDGAHNSMLRIPDSHDIPVRRNVRIGLGKSVLVEFPRDVRDVLVSNPQAVDAVVLSANRVFLLARRIGEANAFFFDANGEQFATLELFVERETAGLEEMLNRLIPGSTIKVEMINQTVVLTGSVRNPADAARAANIAKQFVTVEFETKTIGETEGTAVKKFEKADNETVVINLLNVEAEEQVMLRVVVAEVQRSLLKQFGVNLGAAINSGNFNTAVLTENALPLTAAAGLGSLPTAGFLDGTLGMFNGGQTQGDSIISQNSGVSTNWNTGNQNIRGALRALERAGLIRTLAEPNLTAVSGESAKFLAGGEFPIPLVDGQGQTTVEFKEFGVGVAFTPTVISEGRISLKIETEVSELSNQGAVQISSISIPALRKRQAKSTVELPSGGSLAMAGLLSEDTRQNVDGFPGLKDVPILGTLFRSRDYIRNETELVVIVTPYTVRPTARGELARPADGMSEATDMKANFMGHLNRIYGRGSAIPDGGLKGDYGFIVD
ncbi:MAG: type II and III secretion system protein family protein [Hyphomicrobiaceae bacterium]|nr:type II and III secretion system protein family protein [Hyphomicrobiaceae bacterium]